MPKKQEKKIEKPKELSIEERIREFVSQMKQKRSPFATDEEIHTMYSLHNEKFHTQLNEKVDKSCSICVSRVFRDLEKFIKRLDKNGK